MTDNVNDRIVWIDTELTGLDIETCKIIEVACIVTDENLKVISPNFEVVIHQPEHVLRNMSAWCIEHHSKSGLIDESLSSQISLEQAEQMLLNFLKQYVPEKTCPLAGNTIYMDRMFLHKHMPLVDAYLHYRIIDVSSFKEIVRRWRTSVYERLPKKKLCHRALEDIKESIAELLHYKQILS